MQDPKKIDFDLDFLDKDVKDKPKKNTNTSKEPNWVFYKGDKGTNKNSASDYSKGPSKKWLWILVVIGFFVITGIFSGNSNTSTNNGLVQVGQYMCSDYNASQADNMKPPSNQKSLLDNASSEIDSRSTSLDTEKFQIENEYVDDTDQSSIDAHNAKVDDYNSRLQQYKNDLSSYNSDVATYNAKIDAYNNFLKNNCTPK